MSEEIKVEFIPYSEIPAKHKLQPSDDWLLDELRSLKIVAGTLESGPDRNAFVRCIESTRTAWEKRLHEKE